MKNLLITLMVLLIVLAAGTALAGDMTYKVYGKLHTSLNYVNDGDQTGFTMTSTTFGLEALFKAAEKWHVKGNFYNASAEPDGGESASFSQFALGVDHVFAPSTMFYLQWAMVSNGDMTAAGIGGGDIDGDGSRDYGNGFGAYYAPAITDGTAESPMAISLGVVHSF